jgi:hypothetical protein
MKTYFTKLILSNFDIELILESLEQQISPCTKDHLGSFSYPDVLDTNNIEQYISTVAEDYYRHLIERIELQKNIVE